MHFLPAYPLRHTPRHAWAPMTDAEWERLAPLVIEWRETRRGRPAGDPRRLWDAIFWVACSRGPWRELPEHLGRADTAHRALRRHLRSGLLQRLVIAISPHPLAGGDFASLAWRIARAWRRVARLLTMAQLLLTKRLGVARHSVSEILSQHSGTLFGRRDRKCDARSGRLAEVG